MRHEIDREKFDRVWIRSYDRDSTGTLSATIVTPTVFMIPASGEHRNNSSMALTLRSTLD